ncbi:hypothetical protein HZH66_006971 [Vespula vulgaris]|uniref:Uncharacterized protein n=1 Tax=Vespula vulgaris TaxID=7454 RepID=A0A834K665_VESVU|nr:hypothetical protein HZH66_006971 [Vespula vulgaris]
MSERASKIQLAESPVGIEIQIQETQKSEAENDKRNDISHCTKVPSAKMNVPLETANYPTEIKLTYYHERDIAKGKSTNICTRTLSLFSPQCKTLYLQIVYPDNDLEYCKLMYGPELQTTIQSGFTFFMLDLYRCSV